MVSKQHMDHSFPVLTKKSTTGASASEPVALGSSANIQRLQKQLERVTLAEQKLQVVQASTSLSV